jgi:carbonic anhydrase/acetyltransferase-like protein (isoleucine patch superfamily)
MRLPTRAAVRRRIRAERYARRLGAAVAGDLTPPHPDAYGQYGAGTWVVPPARVTTPERIFLEDDVTIHEHSWLSVVRAVDGVEPTLRIGKGSRIGRFAHIACVGSIDIGPEVLTAERIFIGDTYHGYEDAARPVLHQPMAHPEPVVIGRGAFLGVGSIVLMGVTVGEHAYVGAGAVVTADVAPYTLVVGNPARPVRRWDEATGDWVPIG